MPLRTSRNPESASTDNTTPGLPFFIKTCCNQTSRAPAANRSSVTCPKISGFESSMFASSTTRSADAVLTSFCPSTSRNKFGRLMPTRVPATVADTVDAQIRDFPRAGRRGNDRSTGGSHQLALALVVAHGGNPGAAQRSPAPVPASCRAHTRRSPTRAVTTRHRPDRCRSVPSQWRHPTMSTIESIAPTS